MKTFKSNKTVELLLNKARTHINNVDMDLDFADMANEEINIALRLAEEKKGYTTVYVLNEMYEYTNWDKLVQNKKAWDYLDKITRYKWELKRK